MIQIRLFGTTVGEVDGRVLSASDMGGAKPRQILEILALEGGSAVAKDRLADVLWGGDPPASYVGTLESYVCILRRNMGLGGGRRSVLATTSNGYLLDPEQVSVDLIEFRKLAVRAESATAATALALTEEALRLVGGELLANEQYAGWAVRARESFRRDYVAVCVRGAQLATATGEHATAVRLAQHAVDQDPISEDAGQQFMRALWFSGRRCEALRAYAEMRQGLLDELGDEPGAESQELYLAILRDTPTAGSDSFGGNGMELRTLLRLLRQAIEVTPGVEPPASDSLLAAVAVSALAGVA
jgi:DNA-binding SARP family transcriptional activator